MLIRLFKSFKGANKTFSNYPSVIKEQTINGQQKIKNQDVVLIFFISTNSVSLFFNI